MAKPTKLPLKYRCMFWIGKRLGLNTVVVLDQPDFYWSVTFTKVREE